MSQIAYVYDPERLLTAWQRERLARVRAEALIREWGPALYALFVRWLVEHGRMSEDITCGIAEIEEVSSC